jgi:GDP-D-mannose dehydratase
MDKTPLQVGNLDSYRNIIHASDVANAIFKILEQKNGDNYVICNDNSYKMEYLVMLIYSRANINLVKINNIYFDAETNLPVIVVEENQLSFDSKPTNINGEANKLKSIGWKPLVSIDSIIDEIYFNKI